jgi:hypothetical protein
LTRGATREQRVANGSRRKRDLVKVEGTPQSRSKERMDAAYEWAMTNLPDEVPVFASAAALTLRAFGHPVTPDAVRQRLRDQGKDKATLEEDG